VLACAATFPTILGIYFHHLSAGFAASFGAYLVAVTHTTLPAKGRAPQLIATIVMLCAGATIGAATGISAWIFIPLAVVGAAWQALTEISNTGLKISAAMAVLAMLLSTGNVSPDITAGAYSAAFAGGAVWQGLVQYVEARRSIVPATTLTSQFATLLSPAAVAWGFVPTMATLGLVGGTIVVALPVSHAAWLLTAALRVMKPLRSEMLLRLRQRFIGTAAGAAVSAGLFTWQLPALLYAGILCVMLTVMQLVGPKRYAAWTFCLTIIALDVGMQPHAFGWNAAADRILLTVGGLGLTIVVEYARVEGISTLKRASTSVASLSKHRG
jgi:hypothetical protein